MAHSGDAIDRETVSRNQMEPVFAVDDDRTVAFANERFYEITGLSPSEVVGTDYELVRRVVAEGLDALRTVVESVLTGESSEERVELVMEHPEDAPVPRRLPAQARVTTIRADGSNVGALVSLRRIGTRKTYERRLERQNERLEEFASVVAHDLRNPLNVAEGHLEIAAGQCDSEHLEPVAGALDRMWNIIEDTLSLAKQGHYVGETERVDLSDLVRQCWATVSTPDATLEVEPGAAVEADADRLRNLFENLFRNAVEHGGRSRGSDPGETAEGGERSVTIRVGLVDDGFFVEDDGCGIPVEDRDRVFELGYSTAEEGTGYGLAIVRWIAEAHGWDVAVVDSDDGARFEFTDVDVVRE
ncbi:PAS domain-containing sensor histidine kinase [Halobellus sp. Atlit-31R]|nr:PAS domain-containing sensor histidine kinase [Halobellus sp. Atlit-31R]